MCLYPIEYYSKSLSSLSVELMLLFFILGFLGVTFQKQLLMLSSWMSCIILCVFLKDSANSPFYYSKSQDGAEQIVVAQFEIKNDESDVELIKKLKETEVNILSLRSNTDLDNDKFSFLKSRYPYVVAFENRYAADKTSNFIFSKHKLFVEDTLFYAKNPYLSGYFYPDSCLENKTNFMIFSVDEKFSYDTDSLLAFFNFIELKVKSYNSQSMLILGDLILDSWSYELREFKNKLVLNDSRMDMNFKESGKHIFHSPEFSCIEFLELQNGVIGVYQKINRKDMNDLKASNNYLSQN